MRLSVRQLIQIVILILIAAAMASCSYGFFNFSSDTGRIELSFRFSNINALYVDKLVYDLTSPDGSTVTITLKDSSEFDYYSLDRADTGSWTVKASLYSGETFIQDVENPVDVVKDTTSKLSLEAEYTSGIYNIVPYTSQYADDNGGGSSNYVAPEPDFVFSEMRIMPAFYRAYRTGNEQSSVNVRILGSNLVDSVKAVKILYPDGMIFEYGYMDYYNRAIEVYDVSDNSMLEFNRPFQQDKSLLSGSYRLELTDYNSAAESYEEGLELDFDALMPVITNANIPASFTASDSYNFDYSFSISSDIGTKLAFFVNRDTNAIIPPDDFIRVASSGTLALTPALLNAGSWEMIVVALEWETTQPYTDALALTPAPDMDTAALVNSLYRMYRENTGFIMYTSVGFTVN